MSQVTAVSSSKAKRPYRKGNPLTASERQQAAVARKKATQQEEVRFFVHGEHKVSFKNMCKILGLTQAEMFERWIEMEEARQNKKVTTSHS